MQATCDNHATRGIGPVTIAIQFCTVHKGSQCTSILSARNALNTKKNAAFSSRPQNSLYSQDRQQIMPKIYNYRPTTDPVLRELTKTLQTGSNHAIMNSTPHSRWVHEHSRPSPEPSETEPCGAVTYKTMTQSTHKPTFTKTYATQHTPFLQWLYKPAKSSSHCPDMYRKIEDSHRHCSDFFFFLIPQQLGCDCKAKKIQTRENTTPPSIVTLNM